MQRSNTARLIGIALLAFMATGVLQAQKNIPKSVDFKGFEMSSEQLELKRRVYSEYTREGAMVKQETYEKNPLGKLILRESTSNRNDAKHNYQQFIKYDSLGNILTDEIVTYEKNGRKFRSVLGVYAKDGTVNYYNSYYAYNSKGKLTQINRYDFLNDMTGQEKHEYNKSGEETKVQTWCYTDAAKKHKIATTKNIAYDKKGYLMETTLEKKETLPGASPIVYKEVVKFINNQMNEWIKYMNNAITDHYIRGVKDPTTKPAAEALGNWYTQDEEDENNNKIKTTYLEIDPVTKKEKVVQVNYFTYDDNNNITKTVKEFNEGAKKRVEEEVTEYDHFNNVTRKAEYKDGQLLSESLYVYEYHGSPPK